MASDTKDIPPSSTELRKRQQLDDQTRKACFLQERPPERQDCNIVLFGQTGVGKSTWINAFYAFLRYENFSRALEEATKENKVPVPIPSSVYEYCPSLGDNVIYGTNNGDDDNEHYEEPGDPCTIAAKPHSIVCDNTVYRLIDTAGIGDLYSDRATDNSRISTALHRMCRYDSLHAIFIVLRSDQKRLLPTFDEYMSTILRRLPASAQKNVVFIQTFTQHSNFKPDSVIVRALKSFAAKNELELDTSPKNIFCFDNAFLHNLIKYKDPSFSTVGRSDDDEFNLSNSAKGWEKSVESCHRLLRHLGTLQPLSTEDSELSQIAEIEQIFDAIWEPLLVTIEGIATGSKVNIKPLDKWDVVCNDVSCRGLIGKDAPSPQICHSDCNHSFLWSCSTFALNGVCKQPNCRHDRKQHQFRTATFEFVLDPKAAMKAEEMKEMIKVAAALSTFMRSSALLKVGLEDDFLLDQMTQRINACEKMLLTNNGDKKLQSKKEEYSKIYKEYRAELERLKHKTLNANEVSQQVAGLFRLPHSGARLKEAVGTIRVTKRKKESSNKEWIIGGVVASVGLLALAAVAIVKALA